MVMVWLLWVLGETNGESPMVGSKNLHKLAETALCLEGVGGDDHKTQC